MSDAAVIISRIVSASEVLDDVCARLPDGIPHGPVREAIIEAFSGQRISFPQSMRYAKRNMEIIERFCGDNWGELCREYHISRTHLYRIVRRRKLFSRAND